MCARLWITAVLPLITALSHPTWVDEYWRTSYAIGIRSLWILAHAPLGHSTICLNSVAIRGKTNLSTATYIPWPPS